MKGFDELWLDGSPGNADEAAMLEITFDDKGLRALPVLERAITACNYRVACMSVFAISIPLSSTDVSDIAHWKLSGRRRSISFTSVVREVSSTGRSRIFMVATLNIQAFVLSTEVAGNKSRAVEGELPPRTICI